MTLDQGLSDIRASLRDVAPAEIADVLVEH